VLSRISGPKRDEVTGCWEKLHNEEVHDFNSSSDIIRMIKSRTMRRTNFYERIRIQGSGIRGRKIRTQEITINRERKRKPIKIE
jgi:hypothetical protein